MGETTDPTEASTDARYVRRDSGLLTSELSGTETVMLDIERSEYFGCEGVGRVVWDALDEPRTLRDLVGRVEAEFSATPPEVADDVQEFLDQLIAHDLAAVLDS